MAKVLVSDQYLTAIANAIRNKNGSATTYTPAQMAAAITAIPSTSQPKTVTPSAEQQIILPDSCGTATPTAAVTNSGSSTSYIFPLYQVNTGVADAVYIRLNGDILLAKNGNNTNIWRVTFNNAVIGPIELLYSNGRYSLNSSTYSITQVASGDYAFPYDVYLSINRNSNVYSIYFDTYEDTAFSTKVSFDNFILNWSETSNTFDNYDFLSQVTVNGDADLVASNIKHDVNIFGTTGTFGMKIGSVTAAPSSRGTSVTFSGLQAQPKTFACNLEFEGSFSSARTVYSMIYDGTTLSNCTSYRSGSSILCYRYTTCTWTYNNGTLTITSPSTSTVGYFQPYTYHLLYCYEE